MIIPPTTDSNDSTGTVKSIGLAQTGIPSKAFFRSEHVTTTTHHQNQSLLQLRLLPTSLRLDKDKLFQPPLNPLSEIGNPVPRVPKYLHPTSACGVRVHY